MKTLNYFLNSKSELSGNINLDINIIDKIKQMYKKKNKAKYDESNMFQNSYRP